MPLTWLSLALTATGKGAKKSPSKESGCKGPKTKNASSMWSKSTRMSVEKYEGTWTYISPCLGGSVFKAEFQCYEDEDLCIYQEEKIMQLTSPGSTEAAVVLYEDQANGLGGIAGRFVDTGCIKMAEFSPSEMFWGDALNFVSLDMAIGCDAELDGKILGFKTELRESEEGEIMGMWWSNNDGKNFYNHNIPYTAVKQDETLPTPRCIDGCITALIVGGTVVATSGVIAAGAVFTAGLVTAGVTGTACALTEGCIDSFCSDDGCMEEIQACADPIRATAEVVDSAANFVNSVADTVTSWFGW